MSLAEFHDVLFPLSIGRGASGGPVWQTEIVPLASGSEVRNARWAGSRRRWDVASAVTSVAELAIMTEFFDARRGRLHGFRFRDLLDHSSAASGADISAADQHIGDADGTQTTFQLTKAYGAQSRVIRKPVAGTVRVALDGAEQVSGWSVDPSSGLVTFDVAPDAGVEITAGFAFDCPARFDTDALDITLETYGAGRAVAIPIVELI